MKTFLSCLRALFLGPTQPASWPLTLLSLLLRLTFGWQLLQTGLGKWRHLDGVIEFFTSLSLPMPAQLAWLVTVIETVGGALLLLGLATRFQALVLSSVLLGALFSAHAADLAKDGFDALFLAPPFPFLVATVCLAFLGAGRLSLDHVLFQARPQPVNASLQS